MKINRLFSIAAATMMMVACSSEDTALKNTPAAGPQMQFTATIAAPNSGATTRTEYTEVTTGEAAGTINVAWKEGDEIALIHNGVKDVATVKTINADGSATITGFITKANNGDGVELVYPSALVTSVTNDGPVFDNDLLGRISTQDGTLKYIQDNLDFRRAKGQLSVNETSATLKEAATMNSMHAIWKLTLQNDDETPVALSAKQVSVQLTADVPILRARTAELTTPISSFYLAMEPFPGAPITIEATVGSDTYSYVNESVILEAGKYYQSTVTMTKKTPATVTTAPTAITGIKAGEDKAIVTAGVADGGTMMYKVTTTNTKPTSTEGFSATIPTAQSLAAGTCYVWYYVKADATHADSDIASSVPVTIAEAGISTKDASETFTPTAHTVTKTYFKVSGFKFAYGWRVGYNGNTITISSPDGLNLSQVVFTVGNQPSTSGRNKSHLQVDHGTLTVTGTSQGSTITISGINSPSVTLSAPSATSTNNMWTISQAVVDGKGDASK